MLNIDFKHIIPNSYILAFGASFLSYFLILGLRTLLSTKIERWVGKTKNRWDDLVVGTVEKTSQFFIISSALYIGFQFIPHSKVLSSYVWKIYFCILMWQISIWSFRILDKWISTVIKKRTQKNPATANSISLVQFVFRMILLSMILLFTLSNLGIRITTIIAGLGVGGIAVALALQKILGDLFSSLSIVLDKPFVVGDFVVLDQYMGTVEKIGLKTTRLRSLSGEQIIISNSDLLATRIRNFKRMHERRVVLLLSLAHDISPPELRLAVSAITRIIQERDKVRFDRCHFMKIGLSSMDIETVYWVLSDDYNLHMDIQQEILLEIRQAISTLELSFAHPTTQIHLKNDFLKNSDEKKFTDSIVS